MRDSSQRSAIIVDDEPMFLRFAAIPFGSGICHCTWRLHTFTDCEEALGFYRESAHTVDVLLTDYHMPQMNGLDLIASFREVIPRAGGPLPALLVTADPPAGTLLPSMTTVVRKPFTKEMIARALSEMGVVCDDPACRVERR